MVIGIRLGTSVLNRCVLSRGLNRGNESVFLSWGGTEFKRRGAERRNAVRPLVVRQAEGTDGCREEEDLREWVHGRSDHDVIVFPSMYLRECVCVCVCVCVCSAGGRCEWLSPHVHSGGVRDGACACGRPGGQRRGLLQHEGVCVHGEPQQEPGTPTRTSLTHSLSLTHFHSLTFTLTLTHPHTLLTAEISEAHLVVLYRVLVPPGSVSHQRERRRGRLRP